jgi:hypothetical protein
MNSRADILFYGGAAGGGKSDLGIGLALTRHQRSIIFRRESTQLQGVYDRMAEILGNRDGFNSQDKIWRLKNKKQIEFGACPNPGDETRYQGRPHDLKFFDEITLFLESQVRFLMGWLRGPHTQRKRVIFAGNPPTESAGEWIIKFFAPWLDETHPNPAKPGELRWYAMIDGKEKELESGKGFVHNQEIIRPLSRTFIPSRVQDNPFLMEAGYEAQLQALPEPFRSQFLKGDFLAGRTDSPFQILPTAWVKAAQDRWSMAGRSGMMDSVGVDVARGGSAETVIAVRYGPWFDELHCFPGTVTPDGPAVAALAVQFTRDKAPVHVDVIGVGTSVYDHLKGNNIHVVPINSAEASHETDKTKTLRFANKRAELWWKMREDLDPQSRQDIMLPPDPQLRADLCAPQWKLTARGIQVEGKDDLMKRIGRSTDRGDAIIYAASKTLKKTEQTAYVPQNRGPQSWLT